MGLLGSTLGNYQCGQCQEGCCSGDGPESGLALSLPLVSSDSLLLPGRTNRRPGSPRVSAEPLRPPGRTSRRPGTQERGPGYRRAFGKKEPQADMA